MIWWNLAAMMFLQNLSPNYRGWGLKDLDIDDLVELGAHGVSPEFIAEMHRLGLKDLDIDDLVELANHDVSPQFIAELREMGFKDLDADDFVELRNHDISANFIKIHARIGSYRFGY